MDLTRLRSVSVLLVLLAMTSTVSAYAGHEDFSVNESVAIQKFNANIDQVPDPIMSLISGETVNVHFDEEIDEFNVTKNCTTIGFKMSDKGMEDIKKTPYEKDTLEVWITAENIDTIKNAENPVQKTADMVSTGKIRYETHSVVTSIKMSVATFFAGFI